MYRIKLNRYWSVRMRVRTVYSFGSLYISWFETKIERLTHRRKSCYDCRIVFHLLDVTTWSFRLLFLYLFFDQFSSCSYILIDHEDLCELILMWTSNYRATRQLLNAPLLRYRQRHCVLYIEIDASFDLKCITTLFFSSFIHSFYYCTLPLFDLRFASVEIFTRSRLIDFVS